MLNKNYCCLRSEAYKFISGKWFEKMTQPAANTAQIHSVNNRSGKVTTQNISVIPTSLPLPNWSLFLWSSCLCWDLMQSPLLISLWRDLVCFLQKILQSSEALGSHCLKLIWGLLFLIALHGPEPHSSSLPSSPVCASCLRQWKLLPSILLCL